VFFQYDTRAPRYLFKLKFRVGEKYPVYVHKTKRLAVGAEFCLRTRPVETANAGQIKELKDLDRF
jgi:hypothetical protein